MSSHVLGADRDTYVLESRPPPGRSGLLTGMRVVDLTTDVGYLCGKILADMGATVVKIDPPKSVEALQYDPEAGGRPSRHWLRWQAFNVNKLSAIVDLTEQRARRRLQGLISDADFFIESERPTSLVPLGLDYATLSQINPRLVHVSITPFGQDGPFSQFRANNFTLQAMGGHMAVTGDRDRAPLTINADVAYGHGAAEAAAAAMIAHYHRERTGIGQHVDVSIQQCVSWTLLNSTMTPQLLHRDDERGGADRKERGKDLLVRVIWECADGLVHFQPVGGGGGTARRRSWDRIVTWMEEDGFGDSFLRAKDWNGRHLHDITQEEYDKLILLIQPFLSTYTKADLYARAVRERILIAPIETMPNLLQSPQFEARGSFQPVEIGGISVHIPANFAHLSASPLGSPRAAPFPGQHTDVVFGEDEFIWSA